MNNQALVDLAPLARLMGMGVLLALGPLAWVWLRNTGAAAGRRTQALTLLTLFLTFDLVLFGAFTRLTETARSAPAGYRALALMQQLSLIHISEPTRPY